MAVNRRNWRDVITGSCKCALMATKWGEKKEKKNQNRDLTFRCVKFRSLDLYHGTYRRDTQNLFINYNTLYKNIFNINS